MTPYYQDDACTIYHGDCREILPTLEADVFVMDPPYGIEYSTGTEGKFNGLRISGDDTTQVRDDAIALMAGIACGLCFGSWKSAAPSLAKALLIWEKGDHVGMGDLSLPWKPNFEFIYVIGRGFSGKRTSGVIRFNAPSPNFVQQLHPTEKPVGLLRELIAKCPQGTILDPFMGSGTTLVAAKLEGRRAVGIELEERYCEIAANRLSQGVLF